MRAKCPVNGLIILASFEYFEVKIPPLPVAKNYYKCDNRFHVEIFEDLFTLKEKYLIVLLFPKQYSLFHKTGTDFKQLYSHTIDLPTNTRRGGFSANRFHRIREEKRDYLYDKIMELININSNNCKNTLIYGCGRVFADISNSTSLSFLVTETDTLATLKMRIEQDVLCSENNDQLKEYKTFMDNIRETDSVCYLLYGLDEVQRHDAQLSVKKIFTSVLDCKFNCTNIVYVPYLEYKFLGILYHSSLYVEKEDCTAL